MAIPLSAVRANLISAIGLSGGLFNGGVSILLKVTDAAKLKFNANVTYTTGDVATPNVTFTPCNDDGEIRNFSNADDVIKWVNGAFNDVQAISITVDDANLLAKPFVPPLDPLADAAKQKAKFTKLKAGIQDNKTNALAKVAAAVAQGYNAPTAHVALQDLYAGLVAKKDAVVAIETYYTDRETHYNTILAG